MWPQGEFTWGAAGAWASFLALLGVIARQVGPWRKLSIDAETGFRDGLLVRVEHLEAALQRKDTETEVLRLSFEAERASYRHRINNLNNAFNALLLLLKKGVPVEEAVEAVEKMRAGDLLRETQEATELRAAGIAAAASKKGGA
jgi:hypothetical protein